MIRSMAEFLSSGHKYSLTAGISSSCNKDHYQKKIEQFSIRCYDNVLINSTYFPARTERSNVVLLINSGIGKPQESYYDFACFLSHFGISTYTYNYRGIGNTVTNLKQFSFSALDWGKKDFPAILDYIEEANPESKIFILGHSIGGQLIGFSQLPSSVKGIVLVAAQSGYVEFLRFPLNILSLLLFRSIIPFIIKNFKYLPTKSLGIMENLPPKVLLECCKWCCSPNYLLDHIDNDDLHFGRIKQPLLSLSFSDDLYAPYLSVKWLLKQYAFADIAEKHITPKDVNTSSLGHSCVFEKRFINKLAPLIVEWIENIANKEDQFSNRMVV